MPKEETICTITNTLRERNLLVSFKGDDCIVRSITDEDEDNGIHISIEKYAQELEGKQKTLNQIIYEVIKEVQK